MTLADIQRLPLGTTVYQAWFVIDAFAGAVDCTVRECIVRPLANGWRYLYYQTGDMVTSGKRFIFVDRSDAEAVLRDRLTVVRSRLSALAVKDTL